MNFGGYMNQSNIEINYDQFFLKSFSERHEAMSKMTTENLSYLIKTHAERWLVMNRIRLNEEQISVVEEVIESIIPEFYEHIKTHGKSHKNAIELSTKLESVLLPEDIIQFIPSRAEHIPKF
jgi:hypothetical protein